MNGTARDTTTLNTEAEAFKQRTLAEAARATADADAEAINARANALSGENQALIAANKLVDMLPALVQASAHGIEGAQLTILNGSGGVNDVATGIAAQGLSIYHALQGALSAGANGSSGAAEDASGTPGEGDGAAGAHPASARGS